MLILLIYRSADWSNGDDFELIRLNNEYVERQRPIIVNRCSNVLLYRVLTSKFPFENIVGFITLSVK